MIVRVYINKVYSKVDEEVKPLFTFHHVSRVIFQGTHFTFFVKDSISYCEFDSSTFYYEVVHE